MITEDYVSFETAKLLKEKGFDDEFTNAFYDKTGDLYFIDLLSDFSQHPDNDTDIAASTLYVAMKWLREVHKLEVRSTYDYDKTSWWGNINPMFDETDENSNIYQKALGFDHQGKSYEESCEAAIKYCLENLI